MTRLIDPAIVPHVWPPYLTTRPALKHQTRYVSSSWLSDTPGKTAHILNTSVNTLDTNALLENLVLLVAIIHEGVGVLKICQIFDRRRSESFESHVSVPSKPAIVKP